MREGKSMGLFRSKGFCSICANPNAKEIKDGYICSECNRKAGRFLTATRLSPKEQTVSLVEECISKQSAYNETQKNRVVAFNETRKIDKLVLDEKNRLFKLKGMFTDIYSYDQIVDYEIIEDGESIVKGGLGRAIAGGALLGGVGAVVGGVTGGKKTKGVCINLQIRIGIKDDVSENVYIKLITSETKKNGFVYKTNMSIANDIISILSKIVDDSKPAEVVEEPKKAIDPYEEMKKVKELLDLGIITKEEFEKKKKELLNL